MLVDCQALASFERREIKAAVFEMSSPQDGHKREQQSVRG
jgi:hypothetical protein